MFIYADINISIFYLISKSIKLVISVVLSDEVIGWTNIWPAFIVLLFTTYRQNFLGSKCKLEVSVGIATL